MRRLLALAAVVACHRAPAERGRDGLVIAAEWPGASAEDLEKQVGIPIERALDGAPHVVHLRTRAVAGRVMVAVETEPGLDPMIAAEGVRNRLQNVLVQLPAAISPPTVTRAPGPVVLRYTVTSATLPLTQVTSANDTVVRELDTIPGVVAVDVCGDTRPRTVVAIDAARLAALGLTVADVTTAISRAGTALPAGSLVVRGGSDHVVRSMQVDPSTLADALVAQRDGMSIRVRDLASVTDGTDPAECIAYDNGRRALAVSVHAAPNANLLDLREKLERKLASSHPAGIEVAVLPREKPLAFAIDTDAPTLVVRETRAERIAQIVGWLPQVSRVLVEARAAEVRVFAVEADANARAALAKALPEAYEADALVVQLFGDDPAKLDELAVALADKLRGSKLGAAREPSLHLQIDRTAAAHYDVDASDITNVYAAATTGIEVGEVRVTVPTTSPEQALDTMLRTHVGITVPLRDVAKLRSELEPSEIRREDGRRWVGVRTRADAAAAREAIAKLALPQGYEARLATGEP